MSKNSADYTPEQRAAADAWHAFVAASSTLVRFVEQDTCKATPDEIAGRWKRLGSASESKGLACASAQRWRRSSP